MDKREALEHLRDRLETAKRSQERMVSGNQTTHTNGQDDTSESVAALEKEIRELPELIRWISDFG